MPRTVFFLVFIFFNSVDAFGQQLYYQDVFRGGVTGGGYNPTWNSNQSGEIQLYIEPGSTIRKAFLFIGTYTNQVYPVLSNSQIEINGNNIALSHEITGINHFTLTLGGGGPPHNLRQGVIDITQLMDPNESLLQVTPPSTYSNGAYIEYYVLVAYDNLSMPETNIAVILNEQNSSGIMNYSISGINSFSTLSAVGFGVQTSHICPTTNDGSYVFINDINIGLVKGQDENNLSANCGVTGSFYYQNNTLYGLSDDVANETVSGSDGIANIQNYITNPTELDIRFTYQTLIDGGSGTPTSNAIWQLYLAYTTPCQPFETTLTEEVTICRGDTAQLMATGGSTGSAPAYEWLPQEDLSCYDCPNPLFVGDSTRHYTVRIWNTDSCSKVLPVKVLVHDVPTQANLNLNPATCSESNGSMSISNVVGGTPLYIYNIGGNSSTNPNFNNLTPGIYNLQITDANNCTYSQAFTIEETNPVTAAFTANPQNGIAPLNVNFTNQSAGANLYQWLVNTQTFESFNLNYTFDTAGTYPVQLIAIYSEPHCADTALKVIVVENAFSVIIPTLHAGSQGFWNIQTTNVTHAKVQIYNAIGQLIHQTEQAVSNGPNALWNATGKATGYYFYRVKLTDVEGKEYDYKGKVLVVR